MSDPCQHKGPESSEHVLTTLIPKTHPGSHGDQATLAVCMCTGHGQLFSLDYTNKTLLTPHNGMRWCVLGEA